MAGMNIPNSLIFVTILVATVVLLLSGRPILRFVVRPLRGIFGFASRYLVQPVYNWTLKPLIGLVRRGGRIASKATLPRGTAMEIGATPLKAILHLIESDSLAKQTLGDMPQVLKKQMKRGGWIFRTANANKVVEAVHETLSTEDAQTNVRCADAYYRQEFQLPLSPSIFYEDYEEALIISVLKDVDSGFFHILRRINRNVSRNMLKFISLVFLIVITFPFVINLIDISSAGEHLYGLQFNYLLYAVVLATFFVGLILLRVFYSNSAWKNGYNFNHFVQTYFSKLLNQYKSAGASFANVLNDRTTRLETAAASSNMWFLNIHWLAARQWFLELFVRNMLFQMGRNRLWYYLTIPLFFLIFVPLLFYFVLSPGEQIFGIDNRPWTSWLSNWKFVTVAVPAAALALVGLFSLNGMLEKFQGEITTEGGFSFRSMDVKSAIERNIGPLVREVVDKRIMPFGQGQVPAPPPMPGT